MYRYLLVVSPERNAVLLRLYLLLYYEHPKTATIGIEMLGRRTHGTPECSSNNKQAGGLIAEGVMHAVVG